MKRLTEHELRRLVGRVATGTDGPLDKVLGEALWPGDRAPCRWGDWPQDAVRTWDAACRLFLEMRQAKRGPVSLGQTWLVIEELAGPRQWWEVGGVTWAQIGESLGVPPRKAAYQMHRLGWRLRGVGMGVPDRVVVAAPCVECGRVWPRRLLAERRGPCCRGDSDADTRD